MAKSTPMMGAVSSNRGPIQFVLIAFFSCFTACSKPVEPPAAPVRIALRSVVNSLDPLSENTVHGGSTYLNLYDSLVQRDRALAIKPSLAARWSTPDDLTWIFELRRNARFQDGTPVTAADVKFSLDRVLNTAGIQQAAALAMVDRIEALSESTVKIVTREPSSSLLVRLVDISIIPRGTISSAPTILASGPFKVQSWETGKYVQMEPNPYYWGAKPAISGARYIAFENSHNAMQAFLKNELDILPQIDPDTIQEFDLLHRKDVSVRTDPGLLLLYLAFGMGRSSPFQDLRVRQAVYHAINSERMIQEIQKGYADPATQLVAPIVYGYNNRLQRLPYDPEKSKKLLAQAGFANGFDIRLDVTNNRYRRDVETGKAVVADLAAVGIRVQLNALPLKEWLELRRNGKSTFYQGGWVVGSGDSSGALDYLLHSPNRAAGYGSANDGRYSNSNLDELIEQCGRTMDPRARLKMLEEAMQIAMNDVAAVPLYVEKNLTAIRATVEWEPYPDQIIRLSSVRYAAPNR